MCQRVLKCFVPFSCFLTIFALAGILAEFAGAQSPNQLPGTQQPSQLPGAQTPVRLPGEQPSSQLPGTQPSSQVPVEEPPAPAERKVHRYALLIGVNDYAPPLGELKYCQNDMSELQAHLQAAGFAAENITCMSDRAELPRLRPSRANIDGELRLRLQLANKDDIVLVAFSGHGLHLDGKSYLCPSDAKLDSTKSMISIDEVYAHLEKCRAAQKVLIVDACRNEPIVRGFRSGRLADDLTMQVMAPPRGLNVLSSCEPGQFSAEDSNLKHGVFMHYIIQGLKGAADTDSEIGSGNNNGRISLYELYCYAHEKTKRHVIHSHGIAQLPEMHGKIVGGFDGFAMVPSESRLTELMKREPQPTTAPSSTPTPTSTVGAPINPIPTPNNPAQIPANNTVASNVPVTGNVPQGAFDGVAKSQAAGGTKSVEHPLLRQADAYLRQADFEHAIEAYTAVVNDTLLDAELRREARKSRGASFLARCGAGDIDRALIDQQAAGMPGILMTVRAANADLQVLSEVKGKIKQNQTVLVTRIQGDWLWVDSVDGSDKLKGYITKAAVSQQAVAAAPQVQEAQTVRSATGDGNVQYYNNNGQQYYYNGQYYNNGQYYYNGNETAADRSARKQIETLDRDLDRMYQRGASQGAINAKERALERAEERFFRQRGR